MSLRSDGGGTAGAIQVAGVDQLVLNSDGSLFAVANPATGARSMALATMQKFADEFAVLKSTSGYQKLPSGLIIQWGVASSLASGATTSITLPIAFPNAILQAYATLSATQTGVQSYTVGCDDGGGSKTSINIYNYSSLAAIIRWLAIGY
jgi:hypothetical protein